MESRALECLESLEVEIRGILEDENRETLEVESLVIGEDVVRVDLVEAGRDEEMRGVEGPCRGFVCCCGLNGRMLSASAGREVLLYASAALVGVGVGVV